MVIKYNQKKGFTLAQLMITLLVISIFLAASAPMITRVHKKIPQRAVHGRYYCYRDADNNLKEAYYNSKTQISERTINEANGESCSFKPPNRAASYNIELVGGGAGGSYEFDIKDETGPERRASYVIKDGTGFTGDTVLELTANDLRRAFNNTTITECAPTGSSGDGGDIIYYPYYVENTICKIGSTREDYRDFVKYSQLTDKFNELRNAETNIAGKVYTNTEDSFGESGTAGVINDLCEKSVTWFWENDIAGFKSYIQAGDSEAEATSWAIWQTPDTGASRYEGQKGLENQYVKYEYPISIASAATYQDIDNNLKTLGNNIKAGSCSNSECSNNSFSANIITNYTSDAEELTIDNNTSTSDCPEGLTGTCYVANSGGSQTKYAAVRQENGSSYSVADRIAVGGAGAHLSVSDGEITTSSYADLTIGGVESSCTSSWPSLSIKTFVNERTYKTGKGGHNGEYKQLIRAIIGNDCVFTIGKGGTAGTSETAPTSGEETKLYCATNDIDESASGGSIDGSSYTETLDMFDVLKAHGNPDALWNTLLDVTHTTTLQEGGNSPYQPSLEVYTGYKNTPDIEFGKGGNGNQITDNYLQGYGLIEYSPSSGYGTWRHDNDHSYRPNDLDTNIINNATETEPTKGMPGAIIITW